MVLKIRRRKFQRTPQKGEIVITRRLFRTGESEYLLNGKLCRLRDIQDIFMGTGLGPESYAIIGQERIGQLLSSKPHDRRAIIEEAAGITRFKTKKRLAELRLESAKQNLARVDDIFEEVTRQMNSLKRQAAKAERFAAVRDELRGRLRVVLASRMALMDADQARLDAEIAALTEQINGSAAEIEAAEASQHALTERGYELDRRGPGGAEPRQRGGGRAGAGRGAGARQCRAGERAGDAHCGGRRGAGADADAVERHRRGAGAAAQLSGDGGRRGARLSRSRWRRASRRRARRPKRSLRRSGELEANRRHAMHLLTLAGNARNHTAQGEESLAALEREAERLEAEMGQARQRAGEPGRAERRGAAALRVRGGGAEAAGERDCGAARGFAGAPRGGRRTARARQPTARRAGHGGRAARFAAIADSQPQLLHRHGAAAAEAGRAGRRAWRRWARWPISWR